MSTQDTLPPLPDRAQIREIFMRNGFTVKEGQTDLKDYVYDAAEELVLAAIAAQAHKRGYDSMGIPTECGGPLCRTEEHHPLCKMATVKESLTPQQAQQAQGVPPQAMPVAWSDAIAELLAHIEDVVPDDVWPTISVPVWNRVSALLAPQAEPQTSALEAEGQEWNYVIECRDGFVPNVKGPFNKQFTERTLREFAAMRPSYLMVVRSTGWPEVQSGVEWVDMCGDKRRGRLAVQAPAPQAEPQPEREPRTNELLLAAESAITCSYTDHGRRSVNLQAWDRLIQAVAVVSHGIGTKGGAKP